MGMLDKILAAPKMTPEEIQEREKVHARYTEANFRKKLNDLKWSTIEVLDGPYEVRDKDRLIATDTVIIAEFPATNDRIVYDGPKDDDQGGELLAKQLCGSIELIKNLDPNFLSQAAHRLEALLQWVDTLGSQVSFDLIEKNSKLLLENQKIKAEYENLKQAISHMVVDVPPQDQLPCPP